MPRLAELLDLDRQEVLALLYEAAAYRRLARSMEPLVMEGGIKRVRETIESLNDPEVLAEWVSRFGADEVRELIEEMVEAADLTLELFDALSGIASGEYREAIREIVSDDDRRMKRQGETRRRYSEFRRRSARVRDKPEDLAIAAQDRPEGLDLEDEDRNEFGD